jgi:hypothetical protein
VLNEPLAQKSLWMRPMELLGDVGQGKSCFGPFGDGVSVGASKVHGLRQTYPRLWNHFAHN